MSSAKAARLSSRFPLGSSPKPATPPGGDGEGPDLEAMDADALLAFAAENEIDVGRATSEATLRTKISASLEASA